MLSANVAVPKLLSSYASKARRLFFAVVVGLLQGLNETVLRRNPTLLLGSALRGAGFNILPWNGWGACVCVGGGVSEQ